MRAGEAVLRRAGVGATFSRPNGSRDPGTPPHAPGRTQTCWGEPGTSRARQGLARHVTLIALTYEDGSVRAPTVRECVRREHGHEGVRRYAEYVGGWYNTSP